MAGTATVMTTSPEYQLSADAPNQFQDAPATGNDNVTFQALYSANGPNSITETSGSIASDLQQGTYQVDIDLSAEKSAGTFASGSYTATVVLRCEP